MAIYNQYQYSVGSSYQQFFLSKVPADKDYIIFSTEDNYMMVYGDYDGSSFTDATVYSIARSYSNGRVDISEESSTTVNISYEYYSYSNVGVGTFLVSPQQTYNNFIVNHYTFFTVFLILLVFVGFSIIKKRWIR